MRLDAEQGIRGSMKTRVEDLQTKIVCTIGPASREAGVLENMISAGMDVARLNAGHSSPEEVARSISLIREASDRVGRRVSIMLDLQGPRVRVGRLKDSPRTISTGEEVVFTTTMDQDPGQRIPVSHSGLSSEVKPGDRVLIDDGLLRLVVMGVRGEDITCLVEEGGILRQGKGMNFPGVELGLPSYTHRDKEFLATGLDHGIDWIALSFVREKKDVLAIKEQVRALGFIVPVMAKVEKSEAVENIDSVLEAADGVMVARGDLGVELETEEVPLVQKMIIRKALLAARPVLTATQMLESMITSSRPTRAEATDVANAILDGTDAVMLSAETAIGHDPAKTVETMSRIARRAEMEIDHIGMLKNQEKLACQGPAEAVGYAACRIASDVSAQAIITLTRSGYTARLISRHRPRARIIALTPNTTVANGMSMLWGVKSHLMPFMHDLKQAFTSALKVCEAEGLVKKGETVVMTGGFLEDKPGTTNTINVGVVE